MDVAAAALMLAVDDEAVSMPTVNGPVTSAVTMIVAVVVRAADELAWVAPAAVIVAVAVGWDCAAQVTVVTGVIVAVVVRVAVAFGWACAAAAIVAVPVKDAWARIGAAPTVAVAEMVAVVLRAA